MKKIAADKNYRMHKRAIKKSEMINNLVTLLEEQLEDLSSFVSRAAKQKTIHLIITARMNNIDLARQADFGNKHPNHTLIIGTV